MQAGFAPTDHIRIMLVDDDDTVRDAVSGVLRRKGWNVKDFDNAEDALKELKTSADNYSLVLADVNMPGLNGIEFLDYAQESAPGVPVVMITGYPSIDLAVEAMKKGAIDFLAKPFKSEDLETVIRKAIDGNTLEDEDPLGSVVNFRTITRMPEVARKRLEDKIKELSILHTISETLDEVVDKDEILKKAMDMAQIITDAAGAFVMSVENDGSELVVRAVSGYDDTPGVLGTRFRTEEEPFKSVLKNGSYSYQLLSPKDFSPLLDVSASKDESTPLLLAPLSINREAVMLLGLTGKDWDGDFSTDVITLILNLTAKASLKLENLALSENIFSSIIGALNSLINALDARDTYTKDHSTRVTQYALKIATTLGCGQEVLDSIGFAGPLHDIGKIGVRDDILLKKGSFTENEREIMKSHVVRGEEILRPLNLLDSEKAVVLYHHERFDGKGYPNGLSGCDIPVVARIFSVADTFDAMTSTRPYRKALSHDVAREEIVSCSGTQFDPDVVEAFLDCDILGSQGT